MAPLIEQTNYFDAFEGLPWPFVNREMEEMFPDAKFILSLRKDEQTWLRSMHRHQSRGRWEPAIRFYGMQDIARKGHITASAYRNHTASVRNYFLDKPDRYSELVVDNDSDSNWAALCRIAQCPNGSVPTVEFPRSNTIQHWREGSFIGDWHSKWGWTISRIEEVCVDLYYGRDLPLLRFIFEQAWHFVSVIELACCDLYFKLAVQAQPPLPVKS